MVTEAILEPIMQVMTNEVLNRRDQKRPCITRIEDLPNFDEMPEDELAAWWENHEVSAEVIAAMPEGDLEADLKELGLDPNDYKNLL